MSQEAGFKRLARMRAPLGAVASGADLREDPSQVGLHTRSFSQRPRTNSPFQNQTPCGQSYEAPAKELELANHSVFVKTPVHLERTHRPRQLTETEATLRARLHHSF